LSDAGVLDDCGRANEDTPPLGPAFLSGKLYREDELGEMAVRMANQRKAMWCAFGLSGLLIVLLFYTVSLPRKVPVPITVHEGSGDVRVVQEDWKTYVPPETAYTAQLRQDITNLRKVTLDKEDMKALHRLARTRMTIPGKQQYAQYEKEHKPFDRKEPTQIDGISIVHDGGLTWRARWREITYGHTTTIENWWGKFTFVKAVPQDEEERNATPLGLFLDNWSWSKE